MAAHCTCPSHAQPTFSWHAGRRCCIKPSACLRSSTLKRAPCPLGGPDLFGDHRAPLKTLLDKQRDEKAQLDVISGLTRAIQNSSSKQAPSSSNKRRQSPSREAGPPKRRLWGREPSKGNGKGSKGGPYKSAAQKKDSRPHPPPRGSNQRRGNGRQNKSAPNNSRR